MTITLGHAGVEELDDVVGLIATHQARPERSITYLGATVAGIGRELAALEPPWHDTLRVARTNAAIVGAVVVEWDRDLDRAWVIGPWVDGDRRAWDATAGPLLDAALDQLPAGMADVEVAGDVAHTLLRALAVARGMHPGPVTHALAIDRAVPVPEPGPDQVTTRAATGADTAAITRLHDAAFPATHTSATRLLARARRGDADVLVAVAHDDVLGYAAGQVHPDGEGYVDYLAVHPRHRNRGIGRLLVATLTNRLLSASRTGRVSLTVEGGRTHAAGLYESLGFQPDGSFVAFRTRPGAHGP